MNNPQVHLMTCSEKFQYAKSLIVGKRLAKTYNKTHLIKDVSVSGLKHNPSISLVNSKDEPFAYFCDGAFWEAFSRSKVEFL